MIRITTNVAAIINKDYTVTDEITISPEDFHIEIGDYKTTEPIPYSVLEETLKDLISNWNQKQKEK